MKTDPKFEVLGLVGAWTYDLPDLYGGWTVTAVSGGTVTRAGVALAVGATLAAGDALTFTPTATGGTTNLTIRQANAEFSGNYADLSGIPAGAGTDIEAVQDIVASMLGTVGSYNDAAGTYTITLPQPRTDEEIQDVVAALIQAGANVTKTYNDAGNVLTLSATGGGGGGGATHAATLPATITYDAGTNTYTHGVRQIDLGGGPAGYAPTPTATAPSIAFDTGRFWARFTFTRDFVLAGVDDALTATNQPLILTAYRDNGNGTATLLAQSGPTSRVGGVLRPRLTQPLTITAGQTVFLGLRHSGVYAGTGIVPGVTAAAKSYPVGAGATIGHAYWYDERTDDSVGNPYFAAPLDGHSWQCTLVQYGVADTVGLLPLDRVADLEDRLAALSARIAALE